MSTLIQKLARLLFGYCRHDWQKLATLEHHLQDGVYWQRVDQCSKCKHTRRHNIVSWHP